MQECGSLLELEVTDLDLVQVEQFVAEAVGQSSESVRPLARLVSKKTRGNPFFVEQFLKVLHAEQLLRFDSITRLWQWDLAACEAQRSTDNVIELMAHRIHRSSADTQRTLRYASCFAGEFDASSLMAMLGMERDAVDVALAEAIREELVVQTADDRSPGDGDKVYRFQHDQVRQAAYSLTRREERPQLHLRIGRALLAGRSAEEREQRVFLLLHQLLQGLELVTETAERRQIAELCLTAGRRAKSANAYASAREYLKAGIDVLDDHAWERDYELSLGLHLEYAEASYLGADLVAMEATCAVVLKRGNTLFDQLPAQQLRLLACIARNDPPSAIGLAREVLASLGLSLPTQPSQAAVAYKVMLTAWRLRRETAETLLKRPRAEDPRALAAMQVLALVSTPAYLTSPKLFPILICEMLSLTLEHGNSAWSADALLGWAAIQIAGFNAIERGHAIGSVAPRLIELLGAGARRGRTETIYNLLIRHWVDPLRSTIEPLRQSVKHALEHGDLSYASIGAVTQVYNMLLAGHPLAEVETVALDYDKLLGRLGQTRFRQDARRTLQLVHCLQGKAPDPKQLSGHYYDAEESLRSALHSGDRAALASLHYEQALLLFVYGDTTAALERCRLAASYLDSVLATVYPALIDFLSALVRLRALTSAQPGVRSSEVDDVQRSLARLEKWARMAPANHGHRVHLVRAELARLRGELLVAGREYEQAIELAGQNGYLHEQAMALECAARFYLSTRRGRLAATTMLAARNAWMAWGAAAKAAQLESEFSVLLAGQRPLTLELPSGTRRAKHDAAPAVLDVESVVKASQAIVSEIRLPNLVRRLLALAMENTGAQRGFLLLNAEGQLRVEAASDLDDARTTESSGALRVTAELSYAGSVVEYVGRTLEAVLSPDLSHDPIFAHDAYVKRKLPLSVLCLPLVAQGKLSGIVYLENNRMRGAFSSERLEVLRVLSALAAISLDNARLYEDVAQAHAFQVQLSDAQARFVPAEFLRSLHRASIVDVALGDSIRKEMSILFSDVRGFTSLVESMPADEHVGFINEYLGHMEPAILRHGGFVDSYLGDGILALFEGHADNALRAAIAMSQALGHFNLSRRRSGRTPVQMGVGISTGPLTLGTIGGPGRLKCGVIGDPVNLASRIESLTKRLSSFLLISHETRDLLSAPDAFELRRVDHVRVKGRSSPIVVYEVLDAEPEPRRDAKRRSLARFEEAMALYTNGEFGRAESLFEACFVNGGDDGAAATLAARCHDYRLHPPREWSGVFTLTEK
jgi:predicted ATPase/class 3 adenylate cyclase